MSGGYQPYYLQDQGRWVIGCGGTMTKKECQAEIDRLTGQAPPKRGRPKVDDPLEQHSFRLPGYQIEYLRSKGSPNAALREIIDDAIKNENPQV